MKSSKLRFYQSMHLLSKNKNQDKWQQEKTRIFSSRKWESGCLDVTAKRNNQISHEKMSVVSNAHQPTSAMCGWYTLLFIIKSDFGAEAERSYFFSFMLVSMNVDMTRKRIKEHCSPNVVYQVARDSLTLPALS